MPEMPDVEVFKRYLTSTALHQKIQAVTVIAESLLQGVSAAELAETLKGRSFNSGRRHGKHLFAGMEDGLWLGLHFGMTGSLKYFKNEEKRPEYEAMTVEFDNGYHLSYVCSRKLGEIRLLDDLKAFLEEKHLGPDILGETLDLEKFGKILGESRAAVKSALMNQTLMAGIGNVYSDEILFQAGIYPKKKASRLSQDQMEDLYEAVHSVLDKAVACGADPEKMPETYLIPHREKGGECPRCGKDLKKIEVSGRSGYYCGRCQPEN